MTMFNYGTGETPEQEAARKKRQNQSMLTPGTSPSAVSSGILEQQQSFIPNVPSAPGLATTGAGVGSLLGNQREQQSELDRVQNIQNQVPGGNFVGSPNVLQNIVESRTQPILPENSQINIGNQPVVGGTAPMLDAAGISNMSAGRGTGTPTGPLFSAQNFFDDPGYFGVDRGQLNRMVDGDLGSTFVDDAVGSYLGLGPMADPVQSGLADIAGATAGAIGNIFTGDPQGEQEGGSSAMQRRLTDPLNQFDFIPPDDMIPPPGIAGSMKEDSDDPSKETNKDSLEDGLETRKDGKPPAVFDNPNMASLESQIDGLNTGIGVQTSEALTDAYSSGKGAIESAGGDTVFLNKFFKQVSQPLKFNENGSPYLPEFPGELLQQLTRQVEREIVNPIYTQYIAEGLAVPNDVPPTITETTPVIDPAGEMLLDFYNEYVGNALLMAREAQNQKNQLAVQEIQSNPFGLTAVDQKEIENIRANPFNLTAEQRLSLERQGLSALEFTELELEKQRIGARPNLIQSISGFFQPGTVAALGGTANVEGLLSRLGAFDGVREIMPAVQQTLGTGSETQAQPLAQNYLDSLIGRVPDDVLNSLENGIPLTAARLAQLETENPTALQIYLGNQARQGTSAEGAVLEGLSRQPGVMNRNASTIGANVV